MKANQPVIHNYQFNRQIGFLSIITGYTVASKLGYPQDRLDKDEEQNFLSGGDQS